MCGGSVSFLSPGKAIDKIGAMAEGILKDPLPTIATIALTSVGVPYPVAAAAVTAAQGGSVKEIAISAGTAYIGQQVGQFAGQAAGEFAGEAVSESTKQLITTVVTQASGPAAATALRGGSFQDILEAGVAGGISGALSNTLKTEFNMNPKDLDSKLISNATNAATRAVLQGKSVGEAVFNAATVTALSSGIDSSVNKINQNSTVLTDLRNQFDGLKQTAADFFTSNSLDDLQEEAQNKYTAADEARAEYAGIKSQYDEKFSAYNDAKSRNDVEAANALVPELDGLAEQLNALTPTFNEKVESFNEVFSRLDPANKTYQGYVDQLNSLSGTASTIAQEQEELARKVGEDTIKYQGAVLDERAKLLENVDRQAVIESQNLFDKKFSEEANTAKERIAKLFNLNPEYSSLSSGAQNLFQESYDKSVAERQAQTEKLVNIGPPEIQAFDDGSFQALYSDGTIKVFDDEGSLFRTINEGDTNYDDYALGIKENTKLFGNIGNTPESPTKTPPQKTGVGDAVLGILGGLGSNSADLAKAALIGTLGAGVVRELASDPTSLIAAQGLQTAIPELTASRQANVAPESRRAGSTFFEFVSPVQYGQTTPTVAPTAEAAPVVQAAEGGLMIDKLLDQTNSVQMYAAGGGIDNNQILRLAQANGLGRDSDTINSLTKYINQGMSPQDAADYYHRRNTRSRTPRARGDMEGLMGLAKGGNLPPRYLNGKTDGMADEIPAKIAGKQPAALSHGEFVIPADVVSHLGNGNSEAGAKVLYDMMAKIRKARTGNTKQGKEINPAKFMPKG